MSLEHPTVTKASVARLPTQHGDFEATVYVDQEGREHMSVRRQDHSTGTPLVRLHSECLTGDVFGSRRCDCGDQLSMALQRIAENGNGILLYLRQEGRGIGLANKIKAYELQDEGMDTVEANVHLGFPADARDYEIAADMLHLEGVDAVQLMTNNPLKIAALQEHGIQVETRLEIVAHHDEEREGYISTKVEKMGHMVDNS